MQKYAGCDGSIAFDSYPHSFFAKTLAHRFLAFDPSALIGRRPPRERLASSWSVDSRDEQRRERREREHLPNKHAERARRERAELQQQLGISLRRLRPLSAIGIFGLAAEPCETVG